MGIWQQSLCLGPIQPGLVKPHDPEHACVEVLPAPAQGPPRTPLPGPDRALAFCVRCRRGN